MKDRFLFAKEPQPDLPSNTQPWQVLIIDDEDSIHQITKLVLKNAQFDGRPIELIHAWSAAEAEEILLKQGKDIALALIDVVMESDDAGLQLVEFIRRQQQNYMTRLVLRTGQPGQAPEEEVILKYDINDYKDKSELTSIKLKTVVYSSLRSYRDILTIDHQREALEKVILAISKINQVNSLKLLASAILDQLVTLMGLQADAIYCSTRRLYRQQATFTVLAATGRLQGLLESTPEQSMQQLKEDELPDELQQIFTQALTLKQSTHTREGYVAYYAGLSGDENVLYIKHCSQISQHAKHLLEIFSAEVISTYHSLLLKQEVEETQDDIVFLLGDAIEKRSRETGAHVKRVAEMSMLLAEKYGEDNNYINNLRLASPLHDIGKIAIPDAILNKPEKLDQAEWQVMQTHAEIGAHMLERSTKPVFQLASEIAGSHHEKWDGSGYPNGLQGAQIPLSGRITAIADVFDALTSSRCYKGAWPVENAINLMKQQRGKHFDPTLVDLFLDNIQDFLDICQQNPD